MSYQGHIVLEQHWGVSFLPSDLEKKNNSQVDVNQVCFHQKYQTTSNIRGHSQWGTGSALESRVLWEHVCTLSKKSPASLRLEGSSEMTGALLVPA